jgi:seryl-tRNA synthetase
MRELKVDLGNVDESLFDQLEYALGFVGDEVVSHRVERSSATVCLELADGADPADVEKRVRTLIDRYQRTEFGFREDVYFEQEAETVDCDAWQELLERRWATEVGDGHVILRGDAARLVNTIDRVILRDFASAFDAELETYPATIKCETLDRMAHFTSFPEHVDFVAPLRSDLELLKEFSSACEQGPWSSDLHDGRMAPHVYAVSPSCCYHCYEGMEGWELPKPGRSVTAILGCHRFEGANQRDLTRLRAFTMREIVWVGHPKFVLDSRAKADEMILDLARRWGLACKYQTANDMFFTEDYAVKASFQRSQEAKKELRAKIPKDDHFISIFSSNFHSGSFTKVFNITVGGRPAASACVGWGLERFAFAILSQFGLDRENWPPELQQDFEALG